MEAQGPQEEYVTTLLRRCSVVAVRVMDCSGEGAMSTIITGLEWVLENLQLPAVVLMSIGGDATLLLDQACEALVTAGATVVVAAGNDNEGMEACCHVWLTCYGLGELVSVEEQPEGPQE